MTIRLRLSVNAIKLCNNIVGSPSLQLSGHRTGSIRVPKSTFCSSRICESAKADLLGRTRGRLRRLMIFCSMACCLGLTVLPWIAPRPALASSQAVDETRLPDAAAVVNAYTTLREWISEFSLPTNDAPSAKLPIPQGSGVCILLRRSGRLIGAGSDAESSDDLMVHRAAAQALSAVLSDDSVRRILAQADEQNYQQKKAQEPGAAPPATQPAAVSLDLLHRQIGQGLTIELEVAGKLSPLIGSSLSQMARKLEPGLDGVALRVGKNWTFLFPAHLRATNSATDPERMLMNLVLGTGLPLKDIPSLTQRKDVGFYSFRSMTLAQTAPNRTPIQTFRGDTLVGQSEVTRQGIARLAEEIALHMMESMWPEPPNDVHDPAPAPGARQPVGMLGDYHPIADDYRPLIAPPIDQALAAFALNRFAKLRGVDQEIAGRAAEAGLRILRDLAEVTATEVDPAKDPVACAAIIHAVSEVPSLRDDVLVGPLYQRARQVVIDSYSPRGGFLDRNAEDGKARAISAHGQAMIAGSMARLLMMKDDQLNADAVRSAIDAVWTGVPQPQYVGLLPWIGWAEADLATATGNGIGHLDELNMLAELLMDVQVDAESGSADLAGGFSLQGRTEGSAWPTAQSLRPLAWFCGVPSQPTLWPHLRRAERVGEASNRGIRFLWQLTVRSQSEGAFPNFRRASGGVRQSLWQSQQATSAQSLGLISASDALLAIERIGN